MVGGTDGTNSPLVAMELKEPAVDQKESTVEVSDARSEKAVSPPTGDETEVDTGVIATAGVEPKKKESSEPVFLERGDGDSAGLNVEQRNLNEVNVGAGGLPEAEEVNSWWQPLFQLLPHLRLKRTSWLLVKKWWSSPMRQHQFQRYHWGMDLHGGH